MSDDEERWRHWPRLKQECLFVYTIYERPRDYPDSFVVRRWKVVAGQPTCERRLMLADSLEEARTCVPPDLIRCEGCPLVDDACIVESWL